MDIIYLAKLARLKLTDAEKERMNGRPRGSNHMQNNGHSSDVHANSSSRRG